MKKNAFTLIEILAVILVLGILAVITTTIMGSVLKDSKESLYQRQINTVKEAARKWAILYDYKNPTEVTIEQLNQEGYIEKSIIIDPRDSTKKLCGKVKITKVAGTSKYEFEYNPVSTPIEKSCN